MNANIPKDGSGNQEHHDSTEPWSYLENQCFIFAFCQIASMSAILGKDGSDD